ncbi:hypothetical protein NKJ59_03540 [Mesorhizobium australicum]|uniref:hypothetical protein n=1 Tax=Mesorhizobium australicum TaxID=536018 RepID=UPI003334B4DF
MADPISFNEALARVRVRLGLPNAEDILWEAIRSKQVKAGYPGLHDEEDSAKGAWLDHDLNIRSANMSKADRNAQTKVYLDSLAAWIDSFFAMPAQKLDTNAKLTNRPPDKLEAVKAALRTLPSKSLTGKREPLLMEVNLLIAPMTASKKTLIRALNEMGQK